MHVANARDDLVAQCLLLRRATLELLARRIDVAAWAEMVAVPSERAWRAFLAIEACALTISNRLGDAARLLPPTPQTILRDFSSASVRRILAARAQLSTLDALAARHGVSPVVLKGAVVVAEGRTAFDLGDIDLLLPRDEIMAFSRALVQAGYHEVAGPTNFAIVGGLPIDLHEALHLGWYASFATCLDDEPLAGYQQLRRVRALPNLVHLVQHATTSHGHRRGNLRDACFMAEAMDRCTASELDEASRALSRSRGASQYAETLAFVAAVRAGESTRELGTGYEVIACGNYALALRRRSRLDALLPALPIVRPFFISGGGDARDATRSVLFNATYPASFWYWRALGRHAPRLAAALAYVWRTPYRTALVLHAALGAALVRWRYSTTWGPRAERITPARP